MVKSKKDTLDLIFYEKINIGKSNLVFVRNSNEICIPSILKINNILANIFELGESKDLSPENATSTGCGNRVFIPNYNFPDSLLKKYNISREDMIKVLKYLEKNLEIGKCRYCT